MRLQLTGLFLARPAIEPPARLVSDDVLHPYRLRMENLERQLGTETCTTPHVGHEADH